MSTKTNLQMVNEFHRVFGHTSNMELQKDILETNSKLIYFRISMITEEFDELTDAITKNDFKECIDAICDMMYFVYGTFDVIGYPFDLATSRSLNYKFLEYNLTSKNDKIFDKYKFDLDHHIEYIFKNIQKLKQYTEETNLEMFLWHLNRIERTSQTLGTLFGIDINKCFTEVHRSNMTKLCNSEENAIATVESYKKLLEEGKSTYQQPEFRHDETNGYWVVFDASTSKILKSINFELPKFYFE